MEAVRLLVELEATCIPRPSEHGGDSELAVGCEGGSACTAAASRAIERRRQVRDAHLMAAVSFTSRSRIVSCAVCSSCPAAMHCSSSRSTSDRRERMVTCAATLGSVADAASAWVGTPLAVRVSSSGDRGVAAGVRDQGADEALKSEKKRQFWKLFPVRAALQVPPALVQRAVSFFAC